MKRAKMREPSSGGHPDEPQATVHLREGVLGAIYLPYGKFAVG